MGNQCFCTTTHYSEYRAEDVLVHSVFWKRSRTLRTATAQKCSRFQVEVVKGSPSA